MNMKRRSHAEKQNDACNPVYYELGATVAKFRRIAPTKLTEEQKIAYSEAIRTAVLSKQNSYWKLGKTVHANCASGTFINDNTKGQLHKALQKQLRYQFEAAIEKERRERIVTVEMYREALIWGRFAADLDRIVAELNTPLAMAA